MTAWKIQTTAIGDQTGHTNRRTGTHHPLTNAVSRWTYFASRVAPNRQSAATLGGDVLRRDIRARWLRPADFLSYPKFLSLARVRFRIREILSFSSHVLLPRFWSLGCGFPHQTAGFLGSVQRWQCGALDSALRSGSYRRRTCWDRGSCRCRSVRLPDSATHAPGGHDRWGAQGVWSLA